MLLGTTNGYGKRVEYDAFNAHGRGTRGQMIYVPDDVSGEVVGAVSIAEEDEAMIITSTGKTLKITAESVRILGKAARGVRIVNIGAPDFVIGMDRVVNEPSAAMIEGKADEAVEGSLDKPVDAPIADLADEATYSPTNNENEE
jgi:DNA gyrase subunit A